MFQFSESPSIPDFLPAIDVLADDIDAADIIVDDVT
jgi:hypothetical protein